MLLFAPIHRYRLTRHAHSILFEPIPQRLRPLLALQLFRPLRRQHRLWRGHEVEMSHAHRERNVPGPLRALWIAAGDEVHGKTDVEGVSGVDGVDLGGRQPDRQRLDVLLQVRDFAPAHDRRHVRRLVHHVRERDGCEWRGWRARGGDRVQHGRDGGFVAREQGGHVAALVFLLLSRGRRRFKVPAAQGAPGRKAHALVSAHGDDVPLEVALRGRPAALVDGEGPQAVVARVRVGLGHDPRRRVADAQVQHFSALHEVVETLHHLLDPRGEVPVMHVQQVDVAGLQLLQRRLDAHGQRFGVVGAEIRLQQLRRREDLEARGVFGREDHFVAPHGSP